MSVYLGLDPGGVDTRELLFSGSGDQDVTVCLQDVPFVGFGSWEAHNGAVLLQKGKKRMSWKKKVKVDYWGENKL